MWTAEHQNHSALPVPRPETCWFLFFIAPTITCLLKVWLEARRRMLQGGQWLPVRLNAADCTTKSGNFCDRFQSKHTGRDLAQTIFYRTVGSKRSLILYVQPEQGHKRVTLDGHHLTGLWDQYQRSRSELETVRGCDGDPDSLFPSARQERRYAFAVAVF